MRRTVWKVVNVVDGQTFYVTMLDEWPRVPHFFIETNVLGTKVDIILDLPHLKVRKWQGRNTYQILVAVDA